MNQFNFLFFYFLKGTTEQTYWWGRDCYERMKVRPTRSMLEISWVKVHKRHGITIQVLWERSKTVEHSWAMPLKRIDVLSHFKYSLRMRALG